MTPRKVVTFRASSIGDALMGKYFLENVHAHNPEARCCMLVGSRGDMIRDLLAGYPWLSVIEANRRLPRSLIEAWRALRGSDIALTQYSEKPFSAPSKIFARLVSKRLIGFEDGWRGNKFLYDALIPFDGEARSDGMIQEEQKALAAVGIPICIRELSITHVDDPYVPTRFNLPGEGYVVIHLFSGSEGRSVSQQKRIEIVRALREVISGTLVLTGGVADVPRAAEAARGFFHVTNLAGKTSMQELISLMARARAVLSLDTGAAHIAAHLKMPLVVLTRKEARTAWWGPAMYGGRPIILTNESVDDARPRTMPHPPSMEMIDIQKIIGMVQKSIL